MKPKYRIVFVGYPCDSEFRTVIYKIQYVRHNFFFRRECGQELYMVLRRVPSTSLYLEISRLLSISGITSNEIEFVRTEESGMSEDVLTTVEKQTRFYLNSLNDKKGKVKWHYPKDDNI